MCFVWLEEREREGEREGERRDVEPQLDRLVALPHFPFSNERWAETRECVYRDDANLPVLPTQQKQKAKTKATRPDYFFFPSLRLMVSSPLIARKREPKSVYVKRRLSALELTRRSPEKANERRRSARTSPSLPFPIASRPSLAPPALPVTKKKGV